MVNPFNETHQHCVIAGNCPRFSVAYRTIEQGTNNVEDIRRKLSEAHELVEQHYKRAVATGTEVDSFWWIDEPLISLEDLTKILQIQTEVEISWIRAFWFYGDEHARLHQNFWQPLLITMEEEWQKLESYVWICFSFFLNMVDSVVSLQLFVFFPSKTSKRGVTSYYWRRVAVPT